MIVLVGWGLFLLVLAGVQQAFDPATIEIALQAGIGLASVVAGLVWWRWPAPGDRRIAIGSGATMLAAIGVALAAFGAEAGPWLILIGAGVAAIGAGGAIAQRRAERG
jgi:hypothetical protein